MADHIRDRLETLGLSHPSLAETAVLVSQHEIATYFRSINSAMSAASERPAFVVGNTLDFDAAGDIYKESVRIAGPTVRRDGRTFLVGEVSNVPKVSAGISSVNDAAGLCLGLVSGFYSAAIDKPLQELTHPNAVNNSLMALAGAADKATDYYLQTPIQQVLLDSHSAIRSLGELLEENVGHAMQPDERGRKSGEAMSIMMPWGIEKPEVSERLPKLLAFGAETSTEFRAELTASLEALPVSARSFLEAGGSRVVGLRRLTELFTSPDALRAHGVTRLSDKLIFVPEEVLSKSGEWVKNSSVGFTCRHEIGHIINATMASTPISDGIAFKSAYAADFERLSPDTITALEKFADKNHLEQAREELFCELFALRTGYSPSLQYKQLLTESFPTVCRLFGPSHD